MFIIDTRGQVITNEPKINATMCSCSSLQGGPSAQNDFDGPIGIEIRGSTSARDFVKKSWAFEMRDAAGQDIKVPLLGAQVLLVHASLQLQVQSARISCNMHLPLWLMALSCTDYRVCAGLSEESDFALYGPEDDWTLGIRNVLTFELSNRIGMWAAQTRFCEVFLIADGAPALDPVTCASCMAVQCY